MADNIKDSSPQQPYNHAHEQPTTMRPLVEADNPYARLRGVNANRQLPKFDEALISKYSLVGPRYTSYPTALAFIEISEGLESKILQQREAQAPLSLHLNFPYDFDQTSSKENRDLAEYLPYLVKEITYKRRLLADPALGQNPLVKQLHLGNGAPAFLSDEDLVKLWRFLQTQFEFLSEDEGDYSIKVDPLRLSKNTLETIRQLGFNRLSLSVQDIENAGQTSENHSHPLELIASLLDKARALGFHTVSVDLVYGLPKQTFKNLDKTLTHLIEMAPDRISVINYEQLTQHSKPQELIAGEDSPNDPQRLAMLAHTVDTLTTVGYQYIGIGLFAKPDNKLAVAQREGKLYRNFQGYTTIGDCDLLGFGVAAFSQVATANTRYLLQNPTDLQTYQQRIVAQDSNPNLMPAVNYIKTSIKDRLREYVIMNLLCHDYIDFKDVNRKFGIDAITYFIDEIRKLGAMQADKLIDMDAAGIRILPRGRLLAQKVAMVFDAYHEKSY